MAGESWRIVVVSNVPPVVARLVPFLRELGHEPAALVTGGMPRPRTTAVAAAVPDGVDVLVPGARASLEPLMAAVRPDFLLSWGFSWLLPPEVLRLPPLGCVNFHPSRLPRHRGPIPISWALRDGEREVGVTFHRMDERFDGGAVLARGSVPLADEVGTIDELGPLLQAEAFRLLPGVLERVARGDPGEPQDESAATSAPMFRDDYAEVDWSQPARRVHDQVRAWSFAMGLPPVSGPWAELGGRRVRLTRTSLAEREGAVRVECRDGPLWVVAWEDMADRRPRDNGA